MKVHISTSLIQEIELDSIIVTYTWTDRRIEYSLFDGSNQHVSSISLWKGDCCHHKHFLTSNVHSWQLVSKAASSFTMMISTDIFLVINVLLQYVLKLVSFSMLDLIYAGLR